MKWQDLDAAKQRKAMILAGLVGFAIVALLWPSGGGRRKPTPGATPVQAKPQKGRGAPQPAPRVLPSPATDAGLPGKWQSMAGAIPGHGFCTLSLELVKDAREPGKYTGAASLSCIPLATFTDPKITTPMSVMLTRQDPLYATLSGSWEKDAIVFRVDKVLNPKECGLTGFAVSKFGASGLAAEFKDGCGGGSVMLRKTG